MNPRRGRESHLHLDAKTVIANLFGGLEWSIFFEQRDADILAMHNSTCFLAAIEVESSPRNVLRNIERDLGNGCHAVAVVALTERYLSQITNKILRHAEYDGSEQIQVFLYDQHGLNELCNWIENLALSHQSNTGVTA